MTMQSGDDAVAIGDARIEAALAELREMIARAFPTATFVVRTGDDPEGVYLIPTVDVPDTDVVFDVVVNRLLDLQIDERVPVYVFPIRPIARIRAELEAERGGRRRKSLVTLLTTEP